MYTGSRRLYVTVRNRNGDHDVPLNVITDDGKLMSNRLRSIIRNNQLVEGGADPAISRVITAKIERLEQDRKCARENNPPDQKKLDHIAEKINELVLFHLHLFGMVPA